jgi:hypothetical protein
MEETIFEVIALGIAIFVFCRGISKEQRKSE